MEAVQRKPDRRIERTKHALRDALMQLVIERGYESITVQDIVERANVARTTFYLHYKDKDDLLFRGMRDVYDTLIEGMLKTPDRVPQLTESMIVDDSSDFKHIAEHAEFYKEIIGPKGSMAFLTAVRNFSAALFLDDTVIPFSKMQVTPRVPRELTAYFLAGAQIGVVYWWLHQNDMKLSPQQVSRMLNELCVYGSAWALGTQDAPPDSPTTA